jgi:hypothetical protein
MNILVTLAGAFSFMALAILRTKKFIGKLILRDK